MGNKRVRNDQRKFVKIAKEDADELAAFLFALGNQFLNVKNSEGAFDCWKYSLHLNGRNQAAVHNLGILYLMTARPEGALRMLREARRMDPGNFETSAVLAEALRKSGEMAEARALVSELLAKEPDSVVALSTLSLIEYDEANIERAVELNERVLELRPDEAHAMLNRTLIRMLKGDWVNNWVGYELCLSYAQNERMKGLKITDAWAGQELEGKTLCVVSDQGFGDAVQFSRYLPEAKAKGKFGKLIYLVQPEMKAIVSRIPGVDCVGFGEVQRLEYDHFSSLLGVMRVLQVSPENCYRPPHVETDKNMDKLWAARVKAQWDGVSKKVAVVWAGDFTHGNDQARSLPLSKFLEMAEVPGIQLFSFQVGKGQEQLAALLDSPIVELGSSFRDFDDTASALRAMDLLVTCDTSVGHLAGCMGVKTWWLIPTLAEWRHLMSGEESAWYGDARLFRQDKPRDWDTVVKKVCDELVAFAGGV